MVFMVKKILITYIKRTDDFHKENQSEMITNEVILKSDCKSEKYNEKEKDIFENYHDMIESSSNNFNHPNPLRKSKLSRV